MNPFTTEVTAFLKRHSLKSAPVRAALIDMDGTLFDSMPRHSAAWEAMAAEAGLSTIDGEFFLHEGRTGAATLDILFMRNLGRKATPGEIERLYRRKTEIFSSLPQVEVMPGAKRMLTTLLNAGVERVLVTGSGQSTLIDRIDSEFPGIFAPGMRVTSRDVSHGKPHPEPFLKGMELAGENPANCIVIENAPMGVTAGAAAGAFTIAVATGPIPLPELEKAGADIVFQSMPAFADSLPALLNALNTVHIS